MKKAARGAPAPVVAITDVGRKMHITDADLSDIDELARVEIESKRASVPQFVDQGEVDFVSRQRRWQTYFRGESPSGSKPERRVLKAVIDGKIAGYVAGHLTVRHGADAEIQSFYVLREYQRNGIGTRLLIALANYLVGLGARSLTVGIAAKNPYRSFYEKHGARYSNEHWLLWRDILVITEKRPNQSVEPTPGSVTPRALTSDVGKSKTP